MVYKHVKKTRIEDIKQFMNIYGFPNDKTIESIFLRFNGGEPIGFNFLINVNDEFLESSVKQLLSFNIGDDCEIFGINETISMIDENKICFAIDDNDDYICYDIETENIYLYSEADDTFYEVYTETQEIYTGFMFFDDLDG